MRRSWLEISRSAIRSNIDLIRSRIPRRAEIIAVIKAAAYGLGVENILPILVEFGVGHFAVATLDEAIDLRNRDVDGPILVLGGCLQGEEREFRQQDLTAAVFSEESVPPSGIKVQLEIDTGMTRLGVGWGKVQDFLQRHDLNLVGAYSQFASADVDPGFSRLQLKRFLEATEGLDCPRHMCTTPALSFPDSYLDAARVGLAVYGMSPGNVVSGLQPAVSWKSGILAINEVPAGRVVGYGGTFSTQQPSRIAVLPLGYADGYSRALSNVGHVVVKGRLAPVVGRVSMDYTTIDVTDLGVSLEDEVTLMDSDPSSPVNPTDFARQNSTIPYEVLTRIGPRVQRSVVE